MNCDKATQILVDYSEGVLGENKRRAVEEHLLVCGVCRNELDQILRVKEGVRSLESPKRDAQFWQRFDNKLSQRLDEAETMKGALGLRRWVPLPFAAAAVAALLAVVSLLIFGVQDYRPAPAPRLAEELTPGNETDLTITEMNVFSEEIWGDTLLAQADYFNGDIEQEAEDIFLLVEEDFRAVPDEMVLYNIYEPTMDDMLDELSDEEFEEIYDSLASI